MATLRGIELTLAMASSKPSPAFTQEPEIVINLHTHPVVLARVRMASILVCMEKVRLSLLYTLFS